MSLLDDWNSLYHPSSSGGSSSARGGNRSVGDDRSRSMGRREDDQQGSDAAQQQYLGTADEAAENDEEQLAPMFVLEKIDFDLIEDYKNLRLLVVASDCFAFATEDVHVIYHKKDDKEFEIPHRADDEIHKIFLDPAGNHLLVSLSSGENFYIHPHFQKPKVMRCDKMKGIVVESVGWDKEQNNVNTTGNILIGSSDGMIYEATFENKDGLKAWRLAYSLTENSQDSMPIVGLEVEYIPRSQNNQTTRFYVIATTPCRLYQFVGGPNFAGLFSHYMGSPFFQEIPGGSASTFSELHLLHKPFKNTRKKLPVALAWVTAAGIFHATLNFGSQGQNDPVIEDNSIMSWTGKNTPSSIAITEFHILLLYREKLQIVMQPPGLNRVKHRVVFEEPAPKRGGFRGLARDAVTGQIYVYSPGEVSEIVITDEDRDVWRLYLDRALDPGLPNSSAFDVALRLCKNNVKKRDKVLTAKADFLFNKGEFEKAAVIFARTSKSFEEVTLSFINANQRDALKCYLMDKLAQLKKRSGATRNQEATQLNCLCTWLTEIYLDSINQLLDLGKKEEHKAMLTEFRNFLQENKANLNAVTTFNLISSHGLIDEILSYAMLIEDYERVISYFITKKKYPKALEVLSRHCNKSSPQNEELFYTFSPVLMQHLPEELVNTWIQCKFLVPAKLIPALMRYEPSKGKTDQVILYLEHCVHSLKNNDPAIHNLLLARYSALDDDKKLIDFLNTDGETSENFYDPKYALRICKEHNKQHACVRLYSAMGLYEDAVTMALECNEILLAKEIAKIPEGDVPLQKKLWLIIARFVVEKKNNVKEAISFLSETELIKLEDILPFFPDFVLIDDFKEQICSSLEQYNHDIEDLKKEMTDATLSADMIRSDIKELRLRYGFIPASGKCDLCSHNILTREFFLFPCSHAFHMNCLSKEVRAASSQTKAKRILELETQIRRLTQIKDSGTENTDQNTNTLISQLEDLKKELSDHVAMECIFCGEVMIRSVDLQFIDDDHEQAELNSWKVF